MQNTPSRLRIDNLKPLKPEEMAHKDILKVLSGLLLAMFVAMLSSTIVSNALPTIIADLKGTQTGYTWVVVATLLAMTATTPIWGKLADLVNKKVLIQTSLVLFTIGSLAAGLATSMGWLIGARVVQGLGIGGLTALVQIIIAAMVPPRQRGRYSGYIGAVFASATILGPLAGGAIVDSPLGWRGCFFIVIPAAVVAFFALQRTLHLPALTTKASLGSVDWVGATLLTGGISALLAWVSLAGSQFAWGSNTSFMLVGAAVALLVGVFFVEKKQGETPSSPSTCSRTELSRWPRSLPFS